MNSRVNGRALIIVKGPLVSVLELLGSRLECMECMDCSLALADQVQLVPCWLRVPQPVTVSVMTLQLVLAPLVQEVPCL